MAFGASNTVGRLRRNTCRDQRRRFRLQIVVVERPTMGYALLGWPILCTESSSLAAASGKRNLRI
jgi:hypothetical protein